MRTLHKIRRATVLSLQASHTLSGDLIGQYQDAGEHLLINSDYRNDIETHELFASDVIPHFA